MDTIKLWLINVGVKQMGPSLIRAAVAWMVALVVAHQGALTGFGVVYDSSANTLTLHIGVLQEWLLGGGIGLVAAFLTAAQHHTIAAVTGTPQDGSHIRTTDQPK